MKIEMDENSSVAMTVCVICIVIGLVCIGGCKICEQTNQDAIKAGLVQKQNLTPGQAVWSKP